MIGLKANKIRTTGIKPTVLVKVWTVVYKIPNKSVYLVLRPNPLKIVVIRISLYIEWDSF